MFDWIVAGKQSGSERGPRGRRSWESVNSGEISKKKKKRKKKEKKKKTAVSKFFFLFFFPLCRMFDWIVSCSNFIFIIIIMLYRLLFACGASAQFDLQRKPCTGRVKTPVA